MYRRILALAGITLLLSACTDSMPVPEESATPTIRPAKIFTIDLRSGEFMRTFPGTLRSAKQSDLAFRVGGQLVELPAHAGMEVKKGDLLARLDDADFRNQLADWEAKHQLATTQYQKVEKLVSKNFATQSNLDEAAADLKAAKAALDLARDNLRYTELRAPFNGLIG